MNVLGELLESLKILEFLKEALAHEVMTLRTYTLPSHRYGDRDARPTVRTREKEHVENLDEMFKKRLIPSVRSLLQRGSANYKSKSVPHIKVP